MFLQGAHPSLMCMRKHRRGVALVRQYPYAVLILLFFLYLFLRRIHVKRTLFAECFVIDDVSVIPNKRGIAVRNGETCARI